MKITGCYFFPPSASSSSEPREDDPTVILSSGFLVSSQRGLLRQAGSESSEETGVLDRCMGCGGTARRHSPPRLNNSCRTVPSQLFHSFLIYSLCGVTSRAATSPSDGTHQNWRASWHHTHLIGIGLAFLIEKTRPIIKVKHERIMHIRDHLKTWIFFNLFLGENAKLKHSLSI